MLGQVLDRIMLWVMVTMLSHVKLHSFTYMNILTDKLIGTFAYTSKPRSLGRGNSVTSTHGKILEFHIMIIMFNISVIHDIIPILIKNTCT